MPWPVRAVPDLEDGIRISQGRKAQQGNMEGTEPEHEKAHLAQDAGEVS
jgi:hypothetical protein